MFIKRALVAGVTTVVVSALAPFASAAPADVAQWRPGPPVYDIATQTNVDVTMDDGVVLRVDVKVPVDRATGKPAEGPFPSLLTQTPYGKEISSQVPFGSQTATVQSLFAPEDYLVQRGYIAVIAEVRGRGGSGGEFDFWSPREAADGVELAEWAARLPNSNGKVGLFGASYMGVTQYLTAGAAYPNSPIKAAVPEVAINSINKDGLYGGMPNAGFGFGYAGIFGLTGASGMLPYLGVDNPADLAARAQQIVDTSITGFSADMLKDFLTGGPLAYSDAWHVRSPATTIAQTVSNGVPTFAIGGWYDVMGKGPTMNYVGQQNAAAGRDTRLAMLRGQHTDPRFQLLMGPYTHAGIDVALADQIRLRWFDRWLKDIDNGVDRVDDTLHFNLLGTDRWVDSQSWPVPETRSHVYYLDSGPSGTSPRSINDGRLSDRAPASPGSDRVAWTGVSNPCTLRTKVQTAGLLDLLGASVAGLCGPDTEQLSETGALTYTTDPFPTAKVIAGPIGMRLYASSNRPDAEFIVGVERVRADGTVEGITSGGLLASLRELDPALSWTDDADRTTQPYHPFTQVSERPLVPGKVEPLELSIWPTAVQIQPGERLRITVSTSDVPFAMPSTRTLPNLVGGIYDIQRSSVYPSAVTLPMADPEAFGDCALCTPVG